MRWSRREAVRTASEDSAEAEILGQYAEAEILGQYKVPCAVQRQTSAHSRWLWALVCLTRRPGQGKAGTSTPAIFATQRMTWQL